ncbi:CoA transferase [Burkholderia sp. Ac-20384]|uniref:CaiB/BaiF CoA transferase family protein n=1 Tax=Burkholderia sp. Ac-20384 TaxID=2703902 RepID=UPI00198215BB|nr:CoA transferase [Burkholderia sp. Ac-20384]MBN3826892.1 CoA transferase [Burkholderia sp. Ac-20384]
MTTFKPLAGIRVLDFTHVIAGPLATFHLAQLGAEVVKIENRNGGDVMRRGNGRMGFVALNAGKRSIELDLSDAGDRDQALELAREADVLVDSLRPGVLDRFGLGDGPLRALNPGLVYCAISGWGNTGAWRDRPAYDHVVQAATGMTLMAGREGEPPVKTGFPVVDAGTGLVAAMAILAALRERDTTGLGRYLDVSMTGAALQLMYPFACQALTGRVAPPRVGNQGYSGSPAADLFATQDGWVALGANTPRQLAAALGVLGRADIARDPRYFDPPLDAGGPAAFLRASDPAALRDALATAIREWRAADLEAACAGVGVACAKVRTIVEFVDDAMNHDALESVMLSDGDCSVLSPGLGYRVHASRPDGGASA